MIGEQLGVGDAFGVLLEDLAAAHLFARHAERDERVGFPAVLGRARAGEVWRELEARLERPVFEVATPPPSVVAFACLRKPK